MDLIDIKNGNRLLHALPMSEWHHWQPNSESISWQDGEPLEDTATHVFMPLTGVISLCSRASNTDWLEIASVGAEGCIGFPFIAESSMISTKAVSRGNCRGYRVTAQWLMDAMARSDDCLKVLLNFQNALMTQISQTAVCRHHHDLEQQLCRWLMLSFHQLPDRECLSPSELQLQFIGANLTHAYQYLEKMHDQGVIELTSSMIRLIDRREIERRCCDCYGLIQHQYLELW